MSDTLIDVIKARMRKGSDSVVNVVMNAREEVVVSGRKCTNKRSHRARLYGKK